MSRKFMNYIVRSDKDYWVGDPQNGMATFAEAVATLDAANTVCFLNLGPGTHTVTSNLTVPKEITLRIHRGATVTVSDGIVLTVLEPIEAGNYAWFTVTSGGGTLRYYDGSGLMRPTVNAVWFTNAGCGGPDNDPVMRWTGALGMAGIGEAVIKCNVGGRLKVYCPGGVYWATTEVLIQRGEVDIVGEGEGLNAMSSLWVTGENVGGFEFGVSGTDTYRNSLHNFGIYHPDEVAHGPALTLVQNSSFTCRNVAVEGPAGYTSRWSGTGFEFNGWELGYFERINIKATQPIHVKANTSITNPVDFDRFTFHNMSLNAPGTASTSLVKFDSGLEYVTSNTFDFLQLSGGQYAFYWADTGSAAYSYGLTIRDVKCESAYDNAASYFIYLSHNFQMSDLNLIGINFSSFQNFAYLRKVLSTTINGGYLYYSSGGKFIDVGDCFQVTVTGPLIDSATTALTSSDMTEVFRINGGDAAGGNFVPFAIYISSDNVSTINSSGFYHKHSVPASLADDSYTGDTIPGTSAAAFSQWDVCYLNSDGKWAKCDSDSSSNVGPLALATAAATGADETITMLIEGWARNDGWSALTVGGWLYVDNATPGAMVQTAPSGTGDQVQVCGYAIAAKIIRFKGSEIIIEVP